MDRQARINEAKQEVDAMFEGLDDSDAADIIEICQNAIDTIEMRRAKKLRVFEEFYKPLSVSDTDENSSVETTQKITHKYFQLYQALPALEKLRDLGKNSLSLYQARKNTKNELNFQVMIAERKEQLEDLKNEKQIQDTNLFGAEPEIDNNHTGVYFSGHVDGDSTISENVVNKK
ncbi:hypothetical protein BELL_0045g00300 [Botrytis elliptica]|uniref:Uncharacterized protein n=1 Tax=Botrytis elliptica TaxID=278938 RepID=A0A4Z1KCH8_9HELO|nr:hypothetical protein EAE99_001837 [Botrytis elliptica]TGO79057.1 hypothetical protein BELL_0045g00300 [Botrytis elliptica]